MEASALTHPVAAGLRGPTPLLRLQSDERLVTLTRRGNQAAFEALVARYQSRLLAFCRHMLGSREDAEDVLQEVFAASFNAMLADERAINVRPWLYRIARNRSLNHLRKQQAIGVDSMDVHLSENGQSTADKVHKREDFRALVADVQELPETQRTALLLREIDALSYEQIAEAMDTTVPSIKSLLVRARVSLAEMSESRKLTCEEVREELGEVAEGLQRMSPPVRRHLRSCDRCANFRKQLKSTNKALAAIMPVAPLLFLKKAFLAHLGTTASAGAAAGGGAGAAMGASTVASKAAAGLAAAAIVSVGAVEVKRVRVPEPHPPAAAAIQAPPQPVAATPAPAAPAATVAPVRPAERNYVTDRAAAKAKAEAKAAAAERAAATKAAAVPAELEPGSPSPKTVAAFPQGGTQQGGDTTALPEQAFEPGPQPSGAQQQQQPAPQQQPSQQPQPAPSQPQQSPPPSEQPAQEPQPEPVVALPGGAAADQYGP